MDVLPSLLVSLERHLSEFGSCEDGWALETAEGRGLSGGQPDGRRFEMPSPAG